MVEHDKSAIVQAKTMQKNEQLNWKHRSEKDVLLVVYKMFGVNVFEYVHNRMMS